MFYLVPVRLKYKLKSTLFLGLLYRYVLLIYRYHHKVLIIGSPIFSLTVSPYDCTPPVNPPILLWGQKFNFSGLHQSYLNTQTTTKFIHFWVLPPANSCPTPSLPSLSVSTDGSLRSYWPYYHWDFPLKPRFSSTMESFFLLLKPKKFK